MSETLCSEVLMLRALREKPNSALRTTEGDRLRRVKLRPARCPTPYHEHSRARPVLRGAARCVACAPARSKWDTASARYGYVSRKIGPISNADTNGLRRTTHLRSRTFLVDIIHMEPTRTED